MRSAKVSEGGHYDERQAFVKAAGRKGRNGRLDALPQQRKEVRSKTNDNHLVFFAGGGRGGVSEGVVLAADDRHGAFRVGFAAVDVVVAAVGAAPVAALVGAVATVAWTGRVKKAVKISAYEEEH